MLAAAVPPGASGVEAAIPLDDIDDGWSDPHRRQKDRQQGGGKREKPDVHLAGAV
ncbi:hypothetical protein GCM10008174_02480 [Methylopila turkensis]|uniref:Uncharacterized protein n=1 Tax=Methylopila turkensis TaxID=1437816 RepID=A0A9W6N5R5_9HYPH|nr:hypothetical protein GCM10008174_02480 [Methylopila turkensis]